MMKILVTGNTPQQCGRGTMLKYGPVIDLFVRALRDAGVDVDHRVMQPEEDISGYDALWLGMSPINSMSSRYMFAPLEAYARAVKMGKPCVFWIDDWQTQLLNNAYRSILKVPTRLIREPGAKLQDTRYAIDWAREPGNLDKVIEGVKLQFGSDWPKVVAPFYTWGDHLSIFKKIPQVTEANLVAADPSRYVDWYDVKPLADSERKRQWVLGILSKQHDWIDKLGLNVDANEQRWPLFHAGGKAAKADVRLKESELVQVYAESWGVLSPPYWHVGSGWWRNRFVYAAYAGAILAGDPREGSPCDVSYTYPLEMIERFSDQQLRQLADDQKTALLGKMSTREEVQTLLLEVFEKSIAEAK